MPDKAIIQHQKQYYWFYKEHCQRGRFKNIRCNAIAPGFILTEMTEKLPEMLKMMDEQIPLKRGGTPEDVANTALFLASDLSSYITGQTIHVCGGMLT